MARHERALSQELAREPTPQELADRLSTGMDLIPGKADKLVTLYALNKQPISLDTYIGNDTETTVGDMYMEHEAEGRPHNLGQVLQHGVALMDVEMRESVYTALAERLTVREESVLRLRYGIGEPRNHSLEEVGQKYNLTRERIRQIEVKALRKLRLGRHVETLEDFASGVKTYTGKTWKGKA